MNIWLEQIINIFITPPGNLIYHLVLAFSTAMTIQVILVGQHNNFYKDVKRLTITLSIILISQAFLFIISGLAWQGMLNPRLFYPPVDRAITALMLVWISWAWAVPKRIRAIDIGTMLVSTVILILLFMSISAWKNEDTLMYFNHSWLDIGWSILSVFICLAGIILLALHRPSSWLTGMSFLFVNLGGILIHVFFTLASSDFSASIRIAQTLTFMLLPNLLSSLMTGTGLEIPPHITSAPIQGVIPAPLENTKQTVERRRYSADGRTVFSWLQVALSEEKINLYASLSHAIALTLRADICLFISLIDEKIVIWAGYDQALQEDFPQSHFDISQFPEVSDALRHKKIVLWAPGTEPPDQKTLANALQVEKITNGLFVPIPSKTYTQNGILLLSAYTSRDWNDDDVNYISPSLESISRILDNDLLHSTSIPPTQKTAPIKNNSEEIEIELEALKQENKTLLAELERQRQDTPTPDLGALLALEQESQQIIANLQAENAQLKASQESKHKNQDIEQTENDTRHLLEEIVGLQNALANANQKIHSLEPNINNKGLPSDGKDIIEKITGELRQPLVAMKGYTELLLSEAPGPLEILQEKFLRNARSSVDKANSILDEMIRVAEITEGNFEIVPHPVEIEIVLDQVIESGNQLLRKKNITLLLELPEKMPRIYIDQEYLQHILAQLLQHAQFVTPKNGSVHLKIEFQRKDKEQTYLMIQVTDNGGGTSPAALSSIFDIPTGTHPDKSAVSNLAIAKILVETMGGKIWADSKKDISTTYSALLPVIWTENKKSQTPA